LKSNKSDRDFPCTDVLCNLEVEYGLEVIWLSEVTPSKNSYRAIFNLVLVWSDARLVWNSSYHGVEALQLPASQIWIPRIKFFDNLYITERIDEQLENDVVMIFRKQKFINITSIPCTVETYKSLQKKFQKTVTI